MRRRVGETVLLDYSAAGFCSVFDAMGLDRFVCPYVRRLARAWHDEGLFVFYHSDGKRISWSAATLPPPAPKSAATSWRPVPCTPAASSSPPPAKSTRPSPRQISPLWSRPPAN
ncbi:MAG: hypothetical protein IT210_18750 [Armatimonadetes bacterium]|nr:hypothetical protein [Armatimonadota bacterium]